VADDLEIGRYDADVVPELRHVLVDVHVDARADLLDQPFYTAERFAERLDAYAKDPTFSLVTGRSDGQLIGYAFGGTLPATSRWWTGLHGNDDPDLTRETGSRTFAFREILVRTAYQRRGFAHRLHDKLLACRPEERATLLVRHDNPARELYLRWGWRVVGTMQPFPDSPIMDAMIRDLDH
jgi:ribosomal protein S18 acetylase RimI-like enzyme